MQKFLVERAHQHHRPFDEARDFVEETFVLDHFKPLGEGKLLCLGADDVAAALGVEHDLGLPELALIIVETPHRERLRREESMAARLIAGREAADRKRNHIRLLGLRPKHGDDRMQRPHPGQRAR